MRILKTVALLALTSAIVAMPSNKLALRERSPNAPLTTPVPLTTPEPLTTPATPVTHAPLSTPLPVIYDNSINEFRNIMLSVFGSIILCCCATPLIRNLYGKLEYKLSNLIARRRRLGQNGAPEHEMSVIVAQNQSQANGVIRGVPYPQNAQPSQSQSAAPQLVISTLVFPQHPPSAPLLAGATPIQGRVIRGVPYPQNAQPSQSQSAAPQLAISADFVFQQPPPSAPSLPRATPTQGSSPYLA